jgi:hypothetical protein
MSILNNHQKKSNSHRIAAVPLLGTGKTGMWDATKLETIGNSEAREGWRPKHLV